MLADATIAEFEKAHGKVPGCGLVILGLGRLGGGALTHASDLDLIYLFSGSHESESDGPKPLRATDYFNRLAPRISAALSVPTAAGPLYDVDTRLRPSGADGLLAISLDTFARYQRETAWTFEHMALARARPVYGSDADKAALAAIIDDVLSIERDPGRRRRRRREDAARNRPPQEAQGRVRHQARAGRAGRSRIRGPHASSSRTAPPSRPGSARRWRP